MSDWRDAMEAPVLVPEKVPRLHETLTNRTGLWVELQWGGERDRTEVLEIRDLPDGPRVLLVIVNVRRPDIRMAWVYWDPARMSLRNEWTRGAPATAEALTHTGDAHAIDVGEMSDCFAGDRTVFWPHRSVEVRVGGRWHPGRLRCLYNGPAGGAVASVMMLFYEPDWGAPVAFKRLYR
ncbi:hypothetical protein ACWCY6_42525 [Streptomyces sp. 900105755]